MRRPPTEAGTLAELYSAPLPEDVARLATQHAVWCDQAQDYIDVRDPVRVIVTPI